MIGKSQRETEIPLTRQKRFSERVMLEGWKQGQLSWEKGLTGKGSWRRSSCWIWLKDGTR